MQLTRKRNEVTRTDDQPKAKPARKRWKRVVKWTAATIFVALVLWGFIAYWTSSNDCDHKAANPADPMNAAVFCEYGIDNLKVQEIEKPIPGRRSGPGSGSRSFLKSA